MQDGLCPKCGQARVFRRQSSARDRVILAFPNQQALTYVYICQDCGYLEEYILNQKVLDEIPNHPEHWEKVEKI